MSLELCPFCRAHVNAALNFCPNCGRAVNSKEARNIALNIDRNNPDSDIEGGYKLLKKEYAVHRGMRRFFHAWSIFMVLLLAYYLSMKFVFNCSPVPAELISAYKNIFAPH